MMRVRDLVAEAQAGPRTRPLRTALSALGVAIGVASIVAVLGIARSSQARLLAQIDALGTNLLVVAAGASVNGDEVPLPAHATERIARVEGVTSVSPTAELPSMHVYRSDRIAPQASGGLAVRAADARLLDALDGTLAHGRFLDDATGAFPTTVLGAQAAAQLGIGALDRPTTVWLGGHWFTVIGVLRPLPLATEIDRSALVGFPVANRVLGYTGSPSRIYLRTAVERVGDVHALLAASVDPQRPSQVAVSRPSDALTVRAQAAGTLNALFVGLGGVALLVGAIGIANVMVMSVLERRTEIGLRRALGATRRDVAAQFLAESVLLAVLGAVAGLVAGAAVTVGVARGHGWPVQLPAPVLAAGLGAALLVGAVAGLYPAIRAAGLAPTDALRAS